MNRRGFLAAVGLLPVTLPRLRDSWLRITFPKVKFNETAPIKDGDIVSIDMNFERSILGEDTSTMTVGRAR